MTATAFIAFLYWQGYATAAQSVVAWFVVTQVQMYFAYSAIMNFRRAIKKLPMAAKVIAVPYAAFWWIADAIHGTITFSILCLDPQFNLISGRLKSYNNDPDAWAWHKTIVRFAEPMLDPLDHTGNHI
jgi:hypothetical protein